MIELIKQLMEKNIIQYGDFTLKSGIKSNVYIDLRTLIAYPSLFTDVIKRMNTKISSLKSTPNLICGIAYSGIPIATLLSIQNNLPMVVIRKERKEHGTNKLVEGIYTKQQTCLMIDDVITTGSSLIESIKILEENEGLIIKDIVVFIDRRTDRNDVANYNVHSVFKIEELMAAINIINNVQKYDNYLVKKVYECMLHKKTNLILSADVKDSMELLALVETAGPHICILKIHADIMNFVPKDQLLYLANKYNFTIMEDRKLSDIGNTVKQQYANIKWAPLVTVHTIMGEDTIKAIDEYIKENQLIGNNGMFLVAEASCKDHLMDKHYTQRTLEIAQKYKDTVCGFVSQHHLGNSDFMYAAAGINFDATGDALGQQYNTPERAIIEKGVDMIIVGRGIIDASDRYAKLIEYKERGWQAFLKKFEKN